MNRAFFFTTLTLMISCGCVTLICSEKTVQEYMVLARQYNDAGETDKAITCYEQVVAISPNNCIAYAQLGMLFFKAHKFEKSVAAFKKANVLAPDNLSVLHNLSYVLFHHIYNIPEATVFLKKLLDLRPDDLKARELLSQCYLKLGEFEKCSEQRDMLAADARKHGTATEISKLWQGECVANKTILIKDDIGIGDLFLWLRYARLFKAQGARVVVQVRRALIPLLSSCEYIDTLIATDTECTDFDFQTTPGRVHHVIKKSIDDMYTESDTPYVYANDSLVETWKETLSQDHNFKIGVCWDPRPYFNPKTGEAVVNGRAMPLHYFYELGALPQVSLYSLQQRNGLEQLASMPDDFKVQVFHIDFDKKNGNFMDTAAVMKNLDLVITIDTSVAHLAGALGVPVWVVLPLPSDWRWLLGRSDSPWYPTMRLFRSKKSGDWESVMQEVVAALVKKISEKNMRAEKREQKTVGKKADAAKYMRALLR